MSIGDRVIARSGSSSIGDREIGDPAIHVRSGNRTWIARSTIAKSPD
jgi:hypothetical protein